MNTTTRIFRVAMLLRGEIQRIRRVAGSAYMDMTFDYFRIDKLGDIEAVYAQIRDSYDGFLTDSVCADRIIDILSADRACVHGYFEIGLESCYRQILLLTMREPELRVEDIRLDMLPEELSLKGVIEGDRLAQLIDRERERLSGYTIQEAEAYEDELIERHVRRHKDNPNDIVLTGSARVYEGLGRYGSYARYLSLTDDEIRSSIETMRYELERRALMASRSACVYFDMGDEPKEETMEAVKQALIDFRETVGLDELIYNTVGSRYELPTDAATLELLTDGMHKCPYTEYLRERSGAQVHVGYGIGATLREARRAAQAALEYAYRIASPTEQVYLIGTDGHMTAMDIASYENSRTGSSTGGQVQTPIMAAHVNEIAKRAHLASATVLKLIMLLKKQQRTQVDSEWMMRELDMSPRMANKVLSSLEKAGYAHISGKSLINAKGRPSNIYEVRFDMKNQTM